MFRSIRAAAALNGEVRQRIYTFIRSRRRALTREEVAAGLDISPRTAAFHLERLLEGGLLRAHYARPPGRGGPGAGRSAKYYAPSDLQVVVSIPQRRYDLVGRLLVAAIRSQSTGEPASEAALRVARAKGVDAGRVARRQEGLRRPGADRTLGALERALEPYGFEPYRPAVGVIALGNCPFRDLAQEAPELVCAMNRSFVEGVVRGLGNEWLRAELEPRPPECCVAVRSPKPPSHGV